MRYSLLMLQDASLRQDRLFLSLLALLQYNPRDTPSFDTDAY